MFKAEKNIFLNKKGQIFSIDLVVSVVVFIIIFIFLISLWNLYSDRLQENVSSEEMYLVSFQISDILLRTPGTPNNWEAGSNAVTIGLELSPGFLDQNKIDSFLAYDYQEVKEMFNIERFEYNFKIFDVDRNLLGSSGEAPSEAEQVVSINRFALIGNETREILFTLWK